MRMKRFSEVYMVFHEYLARIAKFIQLMSMKLQQSYISENFPSGSVHAIFGSVGNYYFKLCLSKIAALLKYVRNTKQLKLK